VAAAVEETMLDTKTKDPPTCSTDKAGITSTCFSPTKRGFCGIGLSCFSGAGSLKVFRDFALGDFV